LLPNKSVSLPITYSSQGEGKIQVLFCSSFFIIIEEKRERDLIPDLGRHTTIKTKERMRGLGDEMVRKEGRQLNEDRESRKSQSVQSENSSNKREKRVERDFGLFCLTLER
jgi:hypothetical protein